MSRGSCRRAVGRHRRRQAGARPEPRPAAGRICWSSPIPATISSISACSISPDIDTLIYTLAGLDNPEARLGPARRDLVVHGDARRARRRGLVSPRRSRSRGACRAHAAAARPARRCPRSRPTSAAASASVARVLPMTDDRVRTRIADGRGLARFPGLFRAPAMPAGRARAGLRRRRQGARRSRTSGGAAAASGCAPW